MKLRIALGVGETDQWYAIGFGSPKKPEQDKDLLELVFEGLDDVMVAQFIIEADVDFPPPKIVQAKRVEKIQER